MFMWGLYIDPLYLVLFIVTLVISGGAQLYIRSTFSRWSQVANCAGLSGVEVGERLVRARPSAVPGRRPRVSPSRSCRRPLGPFRPAHAGGRPLAGGRRRARRSRRWP